jgi:uncharacterized protein (TIGR04255 family)
VPITRQHYEHAPITEAIIAIACELPDEIGLEDLLKVQSEIKSEYPKRSEQFSIQFQYQTIEAQGKVSSAKVIGYRLASEDEKRIVQVGLGGFAFSQLAPYDRWETLRSEARRIWNVYESALHPGQITRTSVRYINRIDIPDPGGSGIDLDVYFRTGPKIAPELPQTMKTYFVRFELPVREPDKILIITETAVPSAVPGVVSSLLDLDVIVQNVNFDVADAWKTIEELRDDKNAAFEACITDATRYLIK